MSKQNKKECFKFVEDKGIFNGHTVISCSYNGLTEYITICWRRRVIREGCSPYGDKVFFDLKEYSGHGWRKKILKDARDYLQSKIMATL